MPGILNSLKNTFELIEGLTAYNRPSARNKDKGALSLLRSDIEAGMKYLPKIITNREFFK